MKKFVCIIVIVLGISFIFAESKTEKAHDTLKNASSYKESSDVAENNSSHDSDDKDDEETFSNIIVRFLFKSTLKIMFNVNFGENSNFDQLQMVRYNSKPYEFGRTFGSRNSQSNKVTLMNVNCGYGYGTSENSRTFLGNANFNFYGFDLKSQFKMIDEEKSDHNLSYTSLRLERKSVSPSRTDFGIAFGLDNIEIDNDNFTGFSVSHNMEIFFFRPFSFKQQSSVMFYKNIVVSDLISELRIHYKNMYCGGMFNHFTIEEVTFNSVMLNFGIYY